MKLILPALLPFFAILTGAAMAGEAGPAQAPRDPDIAKMISEISAERIERSIHILTSFTTRNTFSDPSPGGNGIGAARAWIQAEFERVADASGGRLQLEADSFQQPAAPGIPRPVEIVNIAVVLPGAQPAARNRVYVVCGHYDSSASSPLDADSPAPGADDDASGVAAVLELARVMSHYEFNATLVFLAVAGEEQGHYGAAHWAAQAQKKGLALAGMLNNDTIGSTRGGDSTSDSSTVRLFAQGVPPAPGAGLRDLLATGGENDTPPRELARAIKEAAALYLPAMNVKLIYRADRYLGDGDQMAFLERGLPAVRFTEPAADFRHQRQDVRVEQGTAYGDTADLINFAYVADVARINAAALAVLACAPATPLAARIDTEKPENDTTLRWTSATEPELAGYRIVWRETTAPLWEHAIDVPKEATRFTVPGVSKDNFIFGVEAVDAAGHASPAAYPLPLNAP